MWPLERRERNILRIGARAVERWREDASGLACQERHAFAAPGAKDEEVDVSFDRLFAGHVDRSATLILESAWMPVMLVEVGEDCWRPEQVRTLVRHRIATLFGEVGGLVTAWDARLDYQAGDRFALGYGLPFAFKQRLEEACARNAVRCDGLLPALAWGLARLRRMRHWDGRRGWVSWPEQDRRLLGAFARGRAVALNAATENSGHDLARRVEIEGARFGIAREEPVVAAHWGADNARAVADQPNVDWIDIAGVKG